MRAEQELIRQNSFFLAVAVAVAEMEAYQERQGQLALLLLTTQFSLKRQ